MKYAWIKKHKQLFPTAVMCRVLNVSTSGYYDSIKRQPDDHLEIAKNEWVKGKIHETYEDGEKDIFKCIEVFYNRKRRHASLGYVSPVVYEEMHEMRREGAA